ncbi:peptide chain release factor N(5)-glutamine methyltransferase [Mucilaginibacter gynuensis]|uniref:peptide chain release factor N(5)-glutamine methyltransferase n=1 Tax=Mucilaginibacter gynuensis TaxID=1302236 RepID=A0ABP8FTW7_9SPHI
METVKDVFNNFREALNGLYDPHETEAITLTVLTEMLDTSKAHIKAFPEKELDAANTHELSRILSELQTGKPLQYVLGETEFYGLKFKVNPAVLIPRLETEELVEWILGSVAGLEVSGSGGEVKILDIGTGSGCIAISLKKYLHVADVSAMDISPAALATAKANAVLNEVEVHFMEDDILNPAFKMDALGVDEDQSKFSIIVSNPPYVTLEDKLQMHTNVTDFEPHTALFVPEHDPLIFYRAIAEFANENLAANGLLFFEINESYGEQTVDLLKQNNFINIELKKDMSGRDRMIKAILNI